MCKCNEICISDRKNRRSLNTNNRFKQKQKKKRDSIEYIKFKWGNARLHTELLVYIYLIKLVMFAFSLKLCLVCSMKKNITLPNSS